MQITPLTSHNQAAALAYLRRAPYRNALPLANATQLRQQSDVLMAEDRGRVLGVATTYHDLPVANLTFAAESDAVVVALLAELAGRNPLLRAGPVFAVLPEVRFRQLARLARLLSSSVEYQMVVEPETLRQPVAIATRRLGQSDVPAMSQLAEQAGLSVWHAQALEVGPAFGCFVGEQLVAMAATHFALPEVIEIGHIATHPAYRRQGYASACTAALTKAAFALTSRVFLMVLEENHPALAAYKRLGFQPMDRFYAARFVLTGVA